MTAFNLYPKFTDRDGYVGWRAAWAKTYATLSSQTKSCKVKAKEEQRGGNDRRTAQKELVHHRAVGRKMMALLTEAELRKERILGMMRNINDQGFPLDLGACKNVDFHFNRGANEFPFLPQWVIKAKGKSYYVGVVNSTIPWTTHEKLNGSTKGVIRFKNARVVIDELGVASLTE